MIFNKYCNKCRILLGDKPTYKSTCPICKLPLQIFDRPIMINFGEPEYEIIYADFKELD